MHAQGYSAVTYDSPQSLRQQLLRLSRSLPSGNSMPQAAALPTAWQVNTAEGSFSISTEPVRNRLGHGDVAGARNWLTDLAGQIDSSGLSRRDSARAASTLHAILARREFAKRAPPSAFERLQQKIAEWIRSWLQRMFVGSLSHPSTWRTAFWIAVVAAVGFLGSLAYRLWSRPLTYRKDTQDRANDLPPQRLWQEWIASARLAAECDDYRRAVQCAYWAGVAKLQDSGNLPSGLTHTPREYLRLLSAGHGYDSPTATREPLRALTVSLERFWYGRSAPTNSDYRACLKSLEVLGCQVP